jgi:hypothetical protein
MGILPIRFRLFVTLIATVIAAVPAALFALLMHIPDGSPYLVAVTAPLCVITLIFFFAWCIVFYVTWTR